MDRKCSRVFVKANKIQVVELILCARRILRRNWEMGWECVARPPDFATILSVVGCSTLGTYNLRVKQVRW